VEAGGPNNTSVSCLGAREVPVVIVASRKCIQISVPGIRSGKFALSKFAGEFRWGPNH
jgi:hypothetical protein